MNINKLIQQRKKLLTEYSTGNYRKNNDPVDFLELSLKEQESLIKFCVTYFIPRKTRNSHYTSYGFKHVFENTEGGFYITNGQFKGAMLISGFKPVNKFCLNSIYCISQKSPVFKLNIF